MDGIEAIVPKNEIKKYKEALKDVENMFNLELEHETYKKIFYKNINNYVCQTESEKLKKKGFFKTRDEIPLGDSVNELVVAKALEQYFINNIPIEKVICNPDNFDLTIYDYCQSNKISKEYEVWYNQKIVQNLNRYYFSKPAPFLLKRKKNTAIKRKLNANFEHVNVSDPVILFNEYQKKDWEDYNINYNHYIAKARQIINEMENPYKQLSLF